MPQMSFFTVVSLGLVASGIWQASRLVSRHARALWSGTGAHRPRPAPDKSAGRSELLLAACLITTGLVILTVPGQIRWVIVLVVSGIGLITMLIWDVAPWAMRRWRRHAGGAASGAGPA